MLYSFVTLTTAIVASCAYMYLFGAPESVLLTLSLLFSYFYSGLCLSLSYLLARPILGHTLRIGRLDIFKLTIWNLSLAFPHAPQHSASPSTMASFVSLSIAPRLPTLASPRFFTLTLTCPHFTTPLCTVTVDALTVRLSLFPTLTRVSAGPWADVTLDVLRLRIFSSSRTPADVKKLREALVSTVFFGQILRIDAFKMSVVFGPDFSGRGRELKDSSDSDEHADSESADEGGEAEANGISDEEEDDAPYYSPFESSFRSAQPDDLLIFASTERFHTHDRKGRIYTFGSASACLRRTWGAPDVEGQRGSYHMEAVDCQWRRLPPFVLGEQRKHSSILWYASSI